MITDIYEAFNLLELEPGLDMIGFELRDEFDDDGNPLIIELYGNLNDSYLGELYLLDGAWVIDCALPEVEATILCQVLGVEDV
jgi:hypothetical protein